MNIIYTKAGDHGMTNLPGGSKISKSNPVFAVLGQIDAVNAQIGLLLAEEIADYGREMLIEIQKKLMALGSIVAGVESTKIKNMIASEDILKLEQEIDSMTEEMPELKHFILPGGDRKSALAHVVRAEVRTLERRLVGYNIDNKIVTRYINRLSDFFFTLARYFNFDSDIEEIIW